MSPLGFDRETNVVSLNDSAEIFAYIYTDRDVPIPEDDLLSVDFTIQRPDATQVVVSGSVEGPGKGYVRYEDTSDVGEYKAVATFTLSDGGLKSVRSDFEVIDPFNPPLADDIEIIGAIVWRRIEDLFDSEEGGPWLQDQTMASFKKEKMPFFVTEGLFDINNQSPPTAVGLESFVLDGIPNPDSPLVVQGTLIAVIRHLIRSYVEQPLPTGVQVGYEDRRDYLQRWQTVLQMEETQYTRRLALWKRDYLGLDGGSRVIVSNKAGRIYQGPMRTRNVGRGYF